MEKLKEYNIESVSDIEKLNDEQTADVLNTMQNYEFDSEFILNFIASLIATAQYPNKMEVGELIMSIPPYVLTDKATITELLDFFSLFIAQKKR